MNALDTNIRELRGIGLEALTFEAALMARHDRKYLVPASSLPALFHALPNGTRILDIDGRRNFNYASVYFDTPEMASFKLAAHGRRNRFKIRTRGYLDTETAFVEVKTRARRDLTVKERVPANPTRLDRLDSNGREFVAGRLAAAGHDARLVHELQPVLANRYARRTLLLPGGAGRATIDTELRWFDLERGEHLTGAELAVIETKSPGTASTFDRTLWSMGHRPVPISKFATGFAALRPDLPANKWHRILANHLSPAPAQKVAA